MTIEELLKKLEDQIDFLGNTFKIPGMDHNDIKQEMRLHVVEDFNHISQEEHAKYNEGWWFKRLKWFLINFSIREKKKPLNKSIRIEGFIRNDKE